MSIACLLLALAGCDRKVAGGKADGPAVYAEACARCHGEKGVPIPALRAQYGVKDLTAPELQDRLTDRAIERQIRRGSADRRMPAFGDALTDAQIEALVEHVRALGQR